MLFARPAAMLRSLTGSSLSVMRAGSGSNTPTPLTSPRLDEKDEKDEGREGAKSPFEDPEEDVVLPNSRLGLGLGVDGLRPHSAAPTEGSRYSTATEGGQAPGQAM
jgi:hypothetical protein